MKTTQRTAMLMFTGLVATALLSVSLAAQRGGGGGAGGAQAAAPAETLSQTYRGSKSRDVEYQKIPPFKIFDNLYHVGIGSVSTWLIPTTDGLILIDSSQEPYVDHILNNIRNVGFDPKNIRYNLIVHGHLDHFGGAARIKELSGARVGMTEADWKLVDEVAKQPQSATPPFNRIVERGENDLVLKDGDTITLGKTSIKVYVTPGHTPGSASFEFTVYDKGRPYKAFMFGGPEPRNGVEGGKQFLASVNRVAQMQDVQVGLLIHSWLAMSTYPNGGTFERAARLQARRGNDPNPFVDPASFRAWQDRLKTVADKYLADEQAKAGTPTAAR